MALRTVGRRAVPSSSSRYGDDEGLDFVGSLFEQWKDKVDHGIGPSPSELEAAAEEVLTKWELEEDRQIPLDPSNPDDALKILETQRAVEQAEAMVECLGPAAAAVYACLSVAMSEHVAAIEGRLGSSKPYLFLIVRAPGLKWQDAVHEAFAAWIGGREAVISRRVTEAVHVRPEAAYGSLGSKRDRKLDVSRVLRFLTDRHVVATVYDEDVQPLLLSMADVVLDLGSTPGPAEFASVVASRFGGHEPAWPEDLYAVHLRPEILEAALVRACEPNDVHRLVIGVALAEGVQMACKSADEADQAAKSVKKNGLVTRPVEPKLADLSGYGPAKVWDESLAADLADYRSGKIGWEDVDAGCLLHGPPGTGKTLFASALAATCGVAFIPASFAAWQGPRGGHVGDVVQEMQRTFALANENAPCIVFIDEIDAIPARGSSKHHDDYWAPIVTSLLECLDGSSRREGVVVVAACNYPQRLDPALVRSGRLDRRFAIELPDEAALVGILAHHLPGIGSDVLEPVATTLAGMTSGADAARIAREARRIARRAGRDIQAEDLLAIAMPADTLAPAARRLVAIHEAGHAVAFMSHGTVPESMSLVPVGDSHGRVIASTDIEMGRLADIERVVVCRLAGRAAEEVVLGEVSAGAEGDLAAATGILSHAMGTCGLGGRLLHDTQVAGAEVEARLRDLYGRALRLVGQHRQAVEVLADLAIEKRVLGRTALAAFAAEHLPDNAGGRR